MYIILSKYSHSKSRFWNSWDALSLKTYCNVKKCFILLHKIVYSVLKTRSVIIKIPKKILHFRKNGQNFERAFEFPAKMVCPQLFNSGQNLCRMNIVFVIPMLKCTKHCRNNSKIWHKNFRVGQGGTLGTIFQKNYEKFFVGFLRNFWCIWHFLSRWSRIWCYFS